MRTLTTLAIAAWMFVHFVSGDLLAQTPGLIVKPAVAGKSVLDPNLDNYTSSDNEGFVSNDEGESEIPFVPIVLVSPEPTSDLATGPSCGFTDLVDDATSYSAAYTYISGSNWLFRFRLGNYATNSKGYSILLDTDGLFGNSGTLKDPNYTTGNPGFEIEIILVTNHGVRLYDADGTASPTLRTTLSYDDYSQKSVAFTTNCSNPDYFYDFYIPIATITTYFPSFSASTTVRMVANTVISTQSVLQGGPSDIGGINDGTYAGNYSNAWTAVVNASVPTAPSNFNSGFPAVRSATPVVNSPLSVGATSVSGTSTEANGTVINVYVNGVSVGATTVTGGTWTLSGIAALTLSASVKATATATGKSVSYDSNAVTVGATCSLAPPAASCQSNKGIGGSGPTGAAAGTTIAFYGPNVPGTFFTSVTTNASNTFLYNCAGGTTNCTGGGPNCITSGIYWITAQESGKCQSPKTTTVCIGTSGTATTPVITTNPILATTTTITGTATAGNTVLLHINGYLQASTTATGGNWTFSGLTLNLGQSVSVYTVQTGQCISSAATRSVTETSTAPVVKSPIVTGATSVSGTSVEAAGTTITLYKTGVSAGTTTVDANGNWTITGLSPALAGGNLIKATATASGESVSGFSNEVTVQSRTTAPVITGTYLEGALAVGGTSSALTGSTITLYIDGVALGTGVVAAGLWTIVTLVTDLYPGGVLTATATETGNAESLPSTSVTVTCALPSGSLGINILTGTTCVNTKASLQVLLSESNVIYTLRNFANTSDAGSSTLGTGGTVTLQSFRITATQTFIIKAVKIPNTACNSSLSTMATVTVTPPSNTTGVLSGDYFWTGSSSNNYWTDDANWVKWNGTAFETVGVSPTTTDNVVIKPMERVSPINRSLLHLQLLQHQP